MTEIDSRFGKPAHNDNPSSELSHASDEVFNEWTKGIKQSFSGLYEATEKLTDQCTALTTCFGTENALNHSKEIESSAQSAIEHGNVEGAKHLLKRDLTFTMWTFGYNNAQSLSLKSQLDNLETGISKSASTANSTGSVNDFSNIFKQH